MKDKVLISAPVTKVEKTKDGGREVYGFVTLERKDKQGEIADFEGTVKAFQKWSDEIAKRTEGKNLGNVRLMHQPVAIGKTISWQPTETVIDGKTYKGIFVGAYIPPSKKEIIKDIDEGILNSFSIGGRYAKRWYDDKEQAFRYIPELSEYSLVDNPAVPGADIMQVISKLNLSSLKGGESMNLEKKDGVTNAHKTPPKGYPQSKEEYGDPDNYKYPIDKQHIKAAVVYFNHEGEKKKGGYTDEQWTRIGRRIASAASRLEGGKYEYKDGKIITPNKKEKEGEKKVKAEDIEKAAQAAGLTLEQVQTFLKALTPIDEPPATIDVKEVDGDGDDDKNEEFPNEPKDDDKIDIEGGMKDVKDAEDEVRVTEKKDKDDLAKIGKALSAKRTIHLKHAINHIHAAMTGADYGPEEHLKVENGEEGTNTGEEAPDVEAEKVFADTLSKYMEGLMNNKIEALVKAMPKNDELLKKFETLEKMVKEIHDTPQPIAPVLNGGSPNILNAFKWTSNVDMTNMEEQALENLFKTTNDTLVKDRISQELALRRAKGIFKGGNK
jgi:hypothetical protein